MSIERSRSWLTCNGSYIYTIYAIADVTESMPSASVEAKLLPFPHQTDSMGSVKIRFGNLVTEKASY